MLTVRFTVAAGRRSLRDCIEPFPNGLATGEGGLTTAGDLGVAPSSTSMARIRFHSVDGEVFEPPRGFLILDPVAGVVERGREPQPDQ